MIYRYHRSRRELSRSPARRREPSGRGGRRIFRFPRGIRWPAPSSRATKGLLYILTPAVALMLAAWSVNTVMQAMTHSRFFELQEIRTRGLERLDEADVLERLRPASGEALFDLDLVSLQGTLLAEPWIKEVNLRREYPNRLSVQVIERYPVAVLAGRPVEAIVDETGAVIEAWPNGGEIPGSWSSLPLIHGIEAASLRDRDPAAVKRFSSAMAILRAAPAAAGQGLDLDVGRRDDLRVQRHGVWIRFGSEPFDEKWERFLSVESEITRRHEGVQEVDLRFSEQVIVR
ncbi:MAG: FtsQ-type POTRA domain-containing protein [Nitrospirota bacterium]